MKTLKDLVKLAMIPIIAFGLSGKIQAQDVNSTIPKDTISVQDTIAKPKTISINGWFEATKGIYQGNNLRIYPELHIKDIKANSLIDLNNFYSFSKTDLSYEKAKVKIGKNLNLKPVLTLHTSPDEIEGTINAKLTCEKGNYFGFFEIDVNPLDVKQPQFFTYHDFATKFGNLGIFATGKIKDLRNTYTEIQFTGKQIKKSGISPYIRMNAVKGSKPTYQLGISLNPKTFYKILQK